MNWMVMADLPTPPPPTTTNFIVGVMLLDAMLTYDVMSDRRRWWRNVLWLWRNVFRSLSHL